MGNCLCSKPHPVEIIRLLTSQSPTSEEKSELIEKVAQQSITKAPMLILTDSSLFSRRKSVTLSSPLVLTKINSA